MRTLRKQIAGLVVRLWNRSACQKIQRKDKEIQWLTHEFQEWRNAWKEYAKRKSFYWEKHGKNISLIFWRITRRKLKNYLSKEEIIIFTLIQDKYTSIAKTDFRLKSAGTVCKGILHTYHTRRSQSFALWKQRQNQRSPLPWSSFGGCKNGRGPGEGGLFVIRCFIPSKLRVLRSST